MANNIGHREIRRKTTMKRERNRQKDKRRCKQTEGETKLKAVSTYRKTNEDANKQKDIR